MAVVGNLLKATNAAVRSALSRFVAGINPEYVCVKMLDVLVVVELMGRADVLPQAVRRLADATHTAIAIGRRARIAQVSHWSGDGA
jgi:hypothetical protein